MYTTETLPGGPLPLPSSTCLAWGAAWFLGVLAEEQGDPERLREPIPQISSTSKLQEREETGFPPWGEPRTLSPEVWGQDPRGPAPACRERVGLQPGPSVSFSPVCAPGEVAGQRGVCESRGRARPDFLPLVREQLAQKHPLRPL